MGADDEPPYPADGLRAIYKAIAAAQRRLLVSGAMTLAVEVDSQGQAVSVSVLQSPDPDMVQLAAAVLMIQKYKPARCHGSPCTMQFPFHIDFKKRL